MLGFYEFIKTELPNLAVVNMDCKWADNATDPYPMQVNDISTLVELLNEKQTEYQISNNLGIMGVSAGGHLGLLWSYAHDTNDQVQMVCSIVRPTNLLDVAYQNSSEPLIQDLIGLFVEDEKLLGETSHYFK